MKKIYLFLSILFVCLSVVGQAIIVSQGVVQNNVYLRGNPVVLSQITLNVPSDGIVLVHFDGLCIPSFGDRIILAASNDQSWHINDGNVEVKDYKKAFSHSRGYNVTAGNHTFYAVAQNYIDLNGTGNAYIYGSFTAEFYPNNLSLISKHKGISKSNINLRGAPVNLGDIAVNAPVSGKVWVHFNGLCAPSPGDNIILAASNSVNWSINAGNSSVYNESGIFSHSMVYNVDAGNHTFYAIGENYMQQAGSGVAYIYGSLSATFFPDVDQNFVESESISKTNENLRGGSVVLAQSDIYAPVAGKALVHFNGTCYPSVGDRIILAASKTTTWEINDGSTSVTSLRGCFSHSRSYDIDAGNHTFYAIGENNVEMAGSGIASVYGHLVVKFFPNNTSDFEDYLKSAVQIYPNPVSDYLYIESDLNMKIEIIDSQGQMIKNVRSVQQNTKIDVADLSKGMYFVCIGDSEGKILAVRKFVKN